MAPPAEISIQDQALKVEEGTERKGEALKRLVRPPPVSQLPTPPHFSLFLSFLEIIALLHFPLFQNKKA